MNRIQTLIEKLKLTPHPEGGYFKEVYRSKGVIEVKDDNLQLYGNRNYCTSIYFLLTSEVFSAFHRIHQDEIWHFYEGAPIIIYVISPSGELKSYTIGNDLLKEQEFQVTIPANHWFAAKVDKENAYGLVGCTVSPGFDFADFELAKKEELIKMFPQHRNIISEFCRI